MSPPPVFLPTSALAVPQSALSAVEAGLEAGIENARATFECSFTGPRDRYGFFVVSGVDALLDALETLKWKPEELAWLAEIGAIGPRAEKLLGSAKFGCDVEGMAEGSIAFPGTPVLTIEGPYWQAQLAASLVAGSIGAPTFAATRAARIRAAAPTAEIVETSGASAHRLGGNPVLARAAFLGGADATTSVLAARRYGLPLRSPEPEAFASALADRRIAIGAWLRATGTSGVVRLAAHDLQASLAVAIRAGKELASVSGTWASRATSLLVDSGDRVHLAGVAAAAFQAAGLPTPRIYAGVEDENEAIDLARSGAPIAGYFVPLGHDETGTGSAAVTCDLTAIARGDAWVPVVRRGTTSPASGDPGRKLVVRYRDAEQLAVADVAFATSERAGSGRDVPFIDRWSGLTSRVTAAKGEPLLATLMRAGKRTAPAGSAMEARVRGRGAIARVPPGVLARTPAAYPVGMSPSLAALKAELLA